MQLPGGHHLGWGGILKGRSYLRNVHATANKPNKPTGLVHHTGPWWSHDFGLSLVFYLGCSRHRKKS